MDEQIAAVFLDYSARKVVEMYGLIEKCFSRLDDEQVWERHAAHENTVANIILHLCGNIRQWIMHGVANAPDVRERDKEFSADGELTMAELLAQFKNTLDEAAAVIRKVSPARLTEKTDPQCRGEVYVLDAIYQVVGHLQQHTGQIILLTKQMSGRDLDLTIPRPR